MPTERYIILNKGSILLADGKLPTLIPDCVDTDMDEGFAVADGCFAPVVTAVGGTTSPGYEWHGLRESWRLLSETEYNLAAKASELLYWRTLNMHCGSCGHPTLRASEISRRCPHCGREIFPSPSPAILVLVMRGEEALLVHARNFSRPFFGLVAGFVETGESLEECVAREVKEETSLEITDIKYFGSQPWPFPFNLMIGFTARYAGGELRFADGELSRGGFFSRDSVPELATPPSLARAMIDSWIEKAAGLQF